MEQTFKRPSSEGILILDYGSQYTLLIARKLRELGYYAEVVDGHIEERPTDFKYHGIILSGGPDSVHEEGSRRFPHWVMDGTPVLGICYGMQLLAEHFDGKLRSLAGREYGPAVIKKCTTSSMAGNEIFKNLDPTEKVWMSHGDDLEALPVDFEVLAETDHAIAAIAHKSMPYVGLQFHPEVHHSVHGKNMLDNFVKLTCGFTPNWDSKCMLEGSIESVKATAGDEHVLMAVSGGVDSTVAASVVCKALGNDKVTAVMVDTGLLRKDEAPWVKENLERMGLKNLHILDERKTFLDKLAGVTDPEEKRKIIGVTFIEVFEKFAKSIGTKFSFLGQGTLYPDVIESAGHGSGSKVIKSHHNVGGLPEKLNLNLVEPFRYNFKDEVRVIGKELGIDAALVDRHPFPGPGLGVRIPGEITEEKIKILQEADDIYISALREHGHYDKIWQALAVLLPVKSVGVMGDNRTYQYTLSIRAICSTDGMTADVYEFPQGFLSELAAKIVGKVDGINRVLYDVTPKPPATIEWE